MAERMRPANLDEVAGHRELVGKDGFLRLAIASGRVPSIVFWGPPGCGKTTLARLLSAAGDLRFVAFSAVTSGVREARAILSEAANLRRVQSLRTLLFIDEIHRFNKAQQDAFLPAMESGDILLVGATTENPAFELNAALLSRCRVVPLQAVSGEEIRGLLERALGDAQRGLGGTAVQCETAVLDALAEAADGDVRRALTQLESVVDDARSRQSGVVTTSDLERHLRQPLRYDKAGSSHYDQLSAFHKSLRDSDADAAVYWLERMLAAGEDPLTLARRMVRVASEDVGLADPQALGVALAAWQAYERLGSPEGELALAQAAIYLALAPASDAVYRASKRARTLVEERGSLPVPLALRNAPTQVQRDAGYGKGYRHAHEDPQGTGGMVCLPEALRAEEIYQPTERGREGELAQRMEKLRRTRRQ